MWVFLILNKFSYLCDMEKFVFNVVSDTESFDQPLDVIEMVECIEGDLSYDRMESIVDSLITEGKIPSGEETWGTITVEGDEITLVID